MGWIKQVEKQAFSHRRHSGRHAALRQGLEAANIAGCADVDLENLLFHRLGARFSVTLQHQHFLVVHGKNFTHAIASFVERIEKLAHRPAFHVDFDNANIGADASIGSVQPAVLQQRTLHDAQQLAAIGRDG